MRYSRLYVANLMVWVISMVICSMWPNHTVSDDPIIVPEAFGIEVSSSSARPPDALVLVGGAIWAGLTLRHRLNPQTSNGNAHREHISHQSVRKAGAAIVIAFR